MARLNPQDKLNYEESYLVRNPKTGAARRYIEGACVVCRNPHTMLYHNYIASGRIIHLRCAQGLWNSGQFQAAQITSKEEIAARVFRKYQHGAANRGVSWSLTLPEFTTIVERNCEYCGDPPTMRWTVMKAERDRDTPLFLYNGIDRKDNKGGYELDNCAPCCTVCNFLKRDMAYSKWVAFLNRVKKNG